MSPRLERALLLHHQGRHELAEQEVRLALADDPDDAVAHAVLARCLSALKKHAEAVEEAQRAVACGPALPFVHATLAAVAYERNDFAAAEDAVREAIGLDPTDPYHFELLAAIHTSRRHWADALHAAEEGLSHDPDHEGCRNLRAMALMKLGRADEAGATTADALARNPDNAATHATRAWGLLHEGKPRKAIEHFREALRLEPELEFARLGMVEAIKAQNWLYRQILSYFLWTSRLSPGARWGVIIGLLVIQQVVATIAKQNPELRPFLDPLLIGYVVFALTTWTAVPLSNLLLRFHPFGRYALTADERRASNWVAGCVALSLVGVGWGVFATSPYDWPGWLSALAFSLLLLPLAGVFACQPGWPRRVMWATAVGMFVLAVSGSGLFAWGFYIADRDLSAAKEAIRTGATLLRINNWAGLGACLLANRLATVHPRL